jgi:peptidoglycan/LPS O-acetylase OafA/YrhL
MKYVKELDSIRALAVLAVMASHWVTIRHPFVNKLLHYGGPVGVDIFFVLSGFLITWILFRNKKNIELKNEKRVTVLKSFYIRRTLRIFPIYYLVIIVLLIFKESSGTQIGHSYPYFLTYTSNFYFFDTGRFDGILSHLWSLAVEEQFYLIWPALMLFTNNRYLLHIIYSFIGIGIISQLILLNDNMGSILTFTCFDAFGIGALLAWYLVFAEQSLPGFYRFIRKAAFFAFGLFIAGLVQQHWPSMPLLRTLISVMTVFVITHIVYKGKGSDSLVYNLILRNRFLIFIGKISYGIYLYHNLIPHYTQQALLEYFDVTPENMLPYKAGYLVMLAINSLILLGLAWGSWKLIEQPVLKLKKHFEYGSPVE